jgi:hypothetical protein
MWCTSCQSDVAAEVSTDSKRVHCTICGNDLGSTSAARISDKTKEARELLARWSNREMLDPYGPLTKSEPRPQTGSSLFDQPEQHHPSSTPQPSLETHTEQQTQRTAPVEVNEQASAPAEEPNHHDSFEPEESVAYQPSSFPQLRSDYRDIQDLIEEDDQSPNWLGLVGQLMAYGGVAVLTIGTTLVLWGYYGGPANYASTGWLISTAGQMLLFLGVITLVSAGMEQASTSVSRRIDRLGQRIFLFEQAMLEQQKSQNKRASTPQPSQPHTTTSEPALRKSA